MQVLVNIMMMPGDEPLNMSPDEIAHAVLQGLGGDEEKDRVQSTIQQVPEQGAAGAASPPSYVPPVDTTPPE